MHDEKKLKTENERVHYRIPKRDREKKRVKGKLNDKTDCNNIQHPKQIIKEEKNE